MKQRVRPKVGLLALTLELYETLLPELRTSREAWLRRAVIPALEGPPSPKAPAWQAPHSPEASALQAEVEVLFTRAVFRREDIEAAVAEFEAARVDALLVILLSYSPSQLALPALLRTRLPIVIWNTQELLAVDQTFTPAKMVDNHGVHGTQDLANVLTRSGVRFHYVTSAVTDPAGIKGIGRFLLRGRGGEPAALGANRQPGLSISRHGRLCGGYDSPGGHTGLRMGEPHGGGLCQSLSGGACSGGGAGGSRLPAEL